MVTAIPKTERAGILFSLSWINSDIRYTDRLYIDNVDFWRDIFPEGLKEKIVKLEEKQSCKENFLYGKIVEPYSSKKIRHIKKETTLYDEARNSVTLQTGRYYPIGIAWKEFSSFSSDTRAFRVDAEEEHFFLCNANHPLAGEDLSITAELLKKHPSVPQRGGSLNDIAELLCFSGPGMQMPLSKDQRREEYDSPYFLRETEWSEEEFYSKPRMVQHLDSTARKHIRNIHASLLTPNMKILDLMSSMESHLSADFRKSSITGLGMNAEEMTANPFLTDCITQNLNTSPILPFADKSFDAVLCTVSLEYLHSPDKVLQEVVRVLAPGGVVLITLSDRWFPGEEIAIWSDLHPFERQGFALQRLLKQRELTAFQSESIRGFPRSINDTLYGKRFTSDPVFSVWGYKRSG